MICSSVIFTSCGKKDQVDANKTDTPVVAKVNGDEISIHQVNFQLGRMGQMNEAQSKIAAKQILARLVQQQLFKQKALEAKLDRDPRILQAFEASKDEILVQAYLEQLMSKADKPSVSQVDGFYKDHPELFEARKIFRLEELVISVGKDKASEVESGLRALKNINDIAGWLKSKNYAFTANSNVKAAEQLPLDLLKKMQPLKDGEFILVPSDKSTSLIQITASKSEPISREKATPIIEQYFLNQNKQLLAKKELETLNAKAKIEFKGEFADMKKMDNTESSTNKAAKSQSAVSESSESKPASIKGKSSSEQSNMDKGLSGL